MGFGNYAIVAGQGEGVKQRDYNSGSNATGLIVMSYLWMLGFGSSNDLPARGESKLNMNIEGFFLSNQRYFQKGHLSMGRIGKLGRYSDSAE